MNVKRAFVTTKNTLLADKLHRRELVLEFVFVSTIIVLFLWAPTLFLYNYIPTKELYWSFINSVLLSSLSYGGILIFILVLVYIINPYILFLRFLFSRSN